MKISVVGRYARTLAIAACVLLLPMLRHAVASPTIKIAIFDLELKDLSAAGPNPTKIPSVLAGLRDSSAEVVQLFSQSAGYTLINTSTADAEAARNHELVYCNGCEAAIAQKLGADQALMGFVTKISMTEYMVDIHIREASTGKLIANLQTGLRIGADYSWSRGVRRLIKDQLLEKR
jgi:hypothetical protein